MKIGEGNFLPISFVMINHLFGFLQVFTSEIREPTGCEYRDPPAPSPQYIPIDDDDDSSGYGYGYDDKFGYDLGVSGSADCDDWIYENQGKMLWEHEVGKWLFVFELIGWIVDMINQFVYGGRMFDRENYETMRFCNWIPKSLGYQLKTPYFFLYVVYE